MSDLLAIDWATALRAMLDIGLAGLVGLLAWRLRRESDADGAAAVGEERERRLRAVHESLQRLVERAQEDARVLDGRLAARVAQVESSLRSAEAVLEAIRAPRPFSRAAAAAEPAAPAVPPSAAAPARASERSVAERVAALAEEHLPVEEIARRVELPIADVRFLLGLGMGERTAAYAGAA